MTTEMEIYLAGLSYRTYVSVITCETPGFMRVYAMQIDLKGWFALLAGEIN